MRLKMLHLPGSSGRRAFQEDCFHIRCRREDAAFSIFDAGNKFLWKKTARRPLQQIRDSGQGHRNSKLTHMVLQGEFLSMLAEPFSVFSVFGHDGGNHIPEIFGMIHMA